MLLRCVPDVRHALDRARRRPDETRADVQQGGLPRAIGPHDGGDLAGSQAQADAAQGWLAAVAFRHRAQAEHDGADPEVCIRWGSRTEGASKLLRVGGGRPVHLARAAPGVFGFSQSVPGQRGRLGPVDSAVGEAPDQCSVPFAVASHDAASPLPEGRSQARRERLALTARVPIAPPAPLSPHVAERRLSRPTS